MPRDAVIDPSLALPGLPFSPAVRADGLLFLSGQVGQDPDTGRLAEGVAAQTAQAIRNLEAVLKVAGKTLDDVVRVGVYLTDMSSFGEMNAEYAKHFSTPYPARTTLGVAALPVGAAVELDLVAR
jgi:2-iminobutanoate/2-iminopropanoate deaminase